MQKELSWYLLPVLRKKYKTVRHLKKYPPKDRAPSYIPAIFGPFVQLEFLATIYGFMEFWGEGSTLENVKTIR